MEGKMPDVTSLAGGIVAQGSTSLQVEAGESAVLSPDSARFKSLYQQIRPQTIDQVKQVIGLSEVTTRTLQNIPLRAVSPAPAVSEVVLRSIAVIPPVSDLNSTDAEVRFSARGAAYQAASAYLESADPRQFAHLTPLINQFLVDSAAKLNVIAFQDIDLANGATLIISNTTHALYANNIRIHGDGRIVCQGKITIKVTTLQGSQPLTTVNTIGLIGTSPGRS
jgi:hypothetical protein